MSVQSILRSVVGLALGLDRNDNLIIGGSKIFYNNETASVAGSVDLANGAAWIAKELLLSQGAVPSGMPPNGTMGANGALSALATALPTIYAGIYLFFPAGAVFAASPAGYYWAAMTSTTAGTVYNNLYVSGTPAAPATLVPVVDAGPGAYTQTTAAYTTAISINVPVGMGLRGALEIKRLASCSNSGNNKTISNFFGASGVGGSVYTTVAGGSSVETVTNRGALNSQVCINAGNGDGNAGAGSLYQAIDFSIAQTLLIRNQLATATDFIICESHQVKMYPN